MFSWRRTVTARRVVLNLKTGKAFSGVLFAKRGQLLIMKQARLMQPGVEPVSVDGEVVVERANVDFIQVLGEG